MFAVNQDESRRRSAYPRARESCMAATSVRKITGDAHEEFLVVFATSGARAAVLIANSRLKRRPAPRQSGTAVHRAGYIPALPNSPFRTGYRVRLAREPRETLPNDEQDHP